MDHSSQTRKDQKKTFYSQDSLDQLPVPEVEETCRKLLEWMEPILSESEYEETRRAIEDFTAENGDGSRLQKALLEWSCKEGVCNWLEPIWYDHYLKDRLPVVINSNIFFMLENKGEKGSVSQAGRAADIIHATLRFHEQILQEDLPCDMEKGCPLCMSQFSRILSTTRVPARGRDILRTPCCSEDPTPSMPDSVIVLFRGHIFVLKVRDSSGYVRSRTRIERAIEKILSSDVSWLSDEECVGALTSLDRDGWADARDMLIESDERNASFLRQIEDALFVICLDDHEPESRDDSARIMLHGDARNRWYDKSIEFVVCPDGTAGINYEHSSLDGSSVVTLTGFIYGHEAGEEENTEEEIPFGELDFNLSSDVREWVLRACEGFDDLVSRTAVRVLDFGHFGKESIKGFRLSPDGFVQMGIQLAYYRLRGAPATTYEPVATRKFLHGRTEAMRSVTPESVEFTKRMTDPHAGNEEKAEALKAAVERHVAGMKECKMGMGVDRHLLGLKSMFFRFGEDLGIKSIPKLFESPGYRKLCHNTISTSTSGHSGLDLCGFGPVVDDGFGVRYLTKPDEINFNLSSRTSNSNDLDKFRTLLEEAYLEMASVMEKAL